MLRRHSAGREEPILPLEADETAPAMSHHKLSDPSLDDINYILGRWGSRWRRERELNHKGRRGATAGGAGSHGSGGSGAAHTLAVRPLLGLGSECIVSCAVVTWPSPCGSQPHPLMGGNDLRRQRSSCLNTACKQCHQAYIII